MDPLFYAIARFYAWCYVTIRFLTGYGIPGLGFLLRRCTRSRYIRFLDQWLYFEPRVASSYGLHIIGRVHEPETHAFLNDVFDFIGNANAVFIDVGANVGAFVVDIARRPNVTVLGFEPAAGCVAAIRRTALRNGRANVLAFENLVGDREELVSFANAVDPQGASVFASAEASSKVQQVTLDDVEMVSALNPTHVVLMVDVEGYEPQVLRGARRVLDQFRPLVIFEYNWVSKQHFGVSEVQAILGGSYKIYRLRKDATLDNELENAWNCVAVPRGTGFDALVEARLRAS